jgi:hypothetical protein
VGRHDPISIWPRGLARKSMQPGKNAQGHGAGWSASWADCGSVEENRSVSTGIAE